MRWTVDRLGPRGGGGVRLGTVDAETKAAAVNEAMRLYGHLGLNAKNIDVRPEVPTY